MQSVLRNRVAGAALTDPDPSAKRSQVSTWKNKERGFRTRTTLDDFKNILKYLNEDSIDQVIHTILHSSMKIYSKRY